MPQMLLNFSCDLSKMLDDQSEKDVNIVTTKSPVSTEEPASATTSPECSEWTQAMEAEMKLLKDNDVWEIVKIHVPAGKKGVGSKWVYKIKNGPDSTPECYKARLATQGFTQKFGSDYDETSCPVIGQESLQNLIHVVLSM